MLSTLGSESLPPSLPSASGSGSSSAGNATSPAAARSATTDGHSIRNARRSATSHLSRSIRPSLFIFHGYCWYAAVIASGANTVGLSRGCVRVSAPASWTRTRRGKATPLSTRRSNAWRRPSPLPPPLALAKLPGRKGSALAVAPSSSLTPTTYASSPATASRDALPAEVGAGGAAGAAARGSDIDAVVDDVATSSKFA